MSNNLPKRWLTREQMIDFRRDKIAYVVGMSFSCCLLQRNSRWTPRNFVLVRQENRLTIRPSRYIAAGDDATTKKGTYLYELARWRVSYNPRTKRFAVKFINGKRS